MQRLQTTSDKSLQIMRSLHRKNGPSLSLGRHLHRQKELQVYVQSHRQFYLFLISLLVLLIDMIVMCILIMVREPQDFGGTLRSYPMTIVFSILALPALMFVTIMFLVHSYLIANDITTKEFLNDKWESSSGNPFRKTNCIKNIIRIFCKFPESEVKFKH